jgi:hypothetical protein
MPLTAAGAESLEPTDQRRTTRCACATCAKS